MFNSYQTSDGKKVKIMEGGGGQSSDWLSN